MLDKALQELESMQEQMGEASNQVSSQEIKFSAQVDQLKQMLTLSQQNEI
jgi:hypothetical protein